MKKIILSLVLAFFSASVYAVAAFPGLSDPDDFTYVENGMRFESQNANGNWFFIPTTGGILTGVNGYNNVSSDFIGICPQCNDPAAALIISKVDSTSFTLNSFNFSGFSPPSNYTFTVRGYNHYDISAGGFSSLVFNSGPIGVTGYSNTFGADFHPQLVTLGNGSYKYLVITTENGAWDCLCVANFDFSGTTVLENQLFVYTPSGPTVEDTNASLQNAAYQLRSAYNSQLAASNLSLTHDCNLFDVKGLCISAGGRYTAIDNPTTNASAAIVTLGYKVNQNIRIGGFLDQNINIHTPGSINVANKNPLMGLYAVWNKEASGLGYQVRLANTYQDKDVTSTRIAYGDTGEAGSGTAKLNSQSYLAELSYAFQYQDKTLVRPYFGLRYTRLKRDGYTETSDTISEPLNFASLSDRSTTALIGARVNYQATPKTTLTANLGIEQDLHHKVDNMIATNTDIGELNAVAFNSNIKRTRPVASAGAYYDVTKAQRLSGTLTYQQLPFQSTGATSLYVNYMIGF